MQACRDYLLETLESTLDLLEKSGSDDAALYFYRLALFHEDMHGEAAVYMAQALGIALPPTLTSNHTPAATVPVQTLQIQAGDWTLGYANASLTAPGKQTASGFAFDNELVPHTAAGSRGSHVSVQKFLFGIGLSSAPSISTQRSVPATVHFDRAVPQYVRHAPN